MKMLLVGMATGHPVSNEMNDRIKSKTTDWVPLEVNKNPFAENDKI